MNSFKSDYEVQSNRFTLMEGEEAEDPDGGKCDDRNSYSEVEGAITSLNGLKASLALTLRVAMSSTSF